MSETVRYVLRVRERARTKRATKGSRKAAIELFCMECLGGCSAY